jgi:hypothetical protein
MKYSKPEVVVLVSAAKAIQMTMKNSTVWQDFPTFHTLNAYEADE